MSQKRKFSTSALNWVIFNPLLFYILCFNKKTFSACNSPLSLSFPFISFEMPFFFRSAISPSFSFLLSEMGSVLLLVFLRHLRQPCCELQIFPINMSWRRFPSPLPTFINSIKKCTSLRCSSFVFIREKVAEHKRHRTKALSHTPRACTPQKNV